MKKAIVHLALITLCLLLLIVMPYLLFKSALPATCTNATIQCQHITVSNFTGLTPNK